MATAVQVRHQYKTQHDHLFFPGMAVLILAVVFLGFAQTYYLGGVLKLPAWKAGAGPPHPLLVHIHAVIFSSWILLLMVQTSLIARRRVEVHRRLGLVGFGLACLLVLAGLAVTCEALARNAPLGDPKLKFPFLQIVDMTVFSTLIYFSYRERFNPAAHKRLALIATVTLLDAAFVRWPVPLIGKNFLAAELCCYSLLVILVSYDIWFTRKFHRATMWGSALVILAHHPILSILNQNIVWHRYAIWMQIVGRFLRRMPRAGPRWALLNLLRGVALIHATICKAIICSHVCLAVAKSPLRVLTSRKANKQRRLMTSPVCFS